MIISTTLAIASYLGVGYVVLAWVAYARNRDAARESLAIALLWPVLIAAVPVELALRLLKRAGWCVDLAWRRELSPFGVRRPTSKAVGRAVRICWVELQVWKMLP